MEAAARHLLLRPVCSGLHAVAELEGADAESVAHAASARNLEVMSLAAYRYDSERDDALVLGYGSVRPAVPRAGVERLAATIATVHGAR